MGKFVLKKYYSQIKVIVGLGNVGNRYSNSRHNAGYLFLDNIEKELKKKYSHASESHSDYDLVKYKEIDLVTIRPKLMMNLSGDALVSYLRFHDLEDLSSLLVVHDDLDIKLGDYKLQFSKSPLSHNGIISIEKSLSSKEFYRIRIGVDNRIDKKIPPVSYVLMKMDEEELEVINKLSTSLLESEFTSLD